MAERRYRAASPKLGRPPRLGLERIVTTAMAMDPNRLTMQAVADELEVSPSALYRWVTDREHLLDLVSAELRRRVEPVEEPTAENWRAWLVDYADHMRDSLREVPGFAVRVLTGPHSHEGHAPMRRAVVQAFVLGGATPERARQYWYVFTTAIAGWVAAEQNDRMAADPPLDFAVLVDVLVRGTVG